MIRKLAGFILLSLFLLPAAFAAAPKKGPRISAWYWLNSAPKNEWRRDFKQMADVGFTGVLMGWGFDLAAFGVRVEDSLDAIKWAHEAGLESYLCIWHPTHNSLERSPDTVQIDAAGHHLFSFDTMNPEWRHTQWRDYLQKIARTYGKLPGMAGYVFDDSFHIGPIDVFNGTFSKPEERYVSYGAAERKAFGAEPPRTKSDPAWPRWVEARMKWWNEWAADTVKFIREVDPNPQHILYLEDGIGILGPDPIDRQGVNFGQVAQPFDAACAYISPPYSAEGADEKIVAATRNSIEKTRAVAGKNKKIVFTFWIADYATERKPGPTTYPTLDQIRKVADTALTLGVDHLDMYGYRIGDAHATTQQWPSKRPGNGPTYPITGQFPGKFLWDRPEILDGLKKYFSELRSR